MSLLSPFARLSLSAVRADQDSPQSRPGSPLRCGRDDKTEGVSWGWGVRRASLILFTLRDPEGEKGKDGGRDGPALHRRGRPHR